MFIRKKGDYFYLVEQAKQKQRVLQYIGKNLPTKFMPLYQKRTKLK